MGFHNVSLPDELAYGFEGGPGLGTIIQSTSSGHEYRIARQSQVRHRYRASKDLLTLAQWATLKDFWAGRRGALHGFRFKDWGDFTTATDGVSAPDDEDNVLGTGDASNKDFQLVNIYDEGGAAPYARTISLPVAGSVVVALDGDPNASWTLTNPGGLITFTTAPANGVVVTAGCSFEVPVRFGAPSDEWLRTNYTSFASIAVPDFELIEILDEIEWPENWWPGGSAALQTTTLDITLNASVKFWPLSPVVPVNAYLPPPDHIPGGEVFVVHVVAAAASTVTVRDDAGVAVTGALGPATTRRIALSRSGSTASWVAY